MNHIYYVRLKEVFFKNLIKYYDKFIDLNNLTSLLFSIESLKGVIY